MKKYALGLTIGLFAAGSAGASGCGLPPLPPLPPLGCSAMQAECVCDASGRDCHYQFVCVPQAR